MNPYGTTEDAVKAVVELFCVESGRAKPTIVEAADAIGVSQPTLSLWLSGQRKPGKKGTKKLCAVVDNQIQPYQVRPDLFLSPDQVEERRQAILRGNTARA